MAPVDAETLRHARMLVGDVTEEHLRYVDAFVTEGFGAFIPVGGQCGYAVTPEHDHPSYMFIIQFDEATRIVVGHQSHLSKPRQLFCLSPGTAHHEVQNYLPPRYCALFIEAARFEAAYAAYCAAPPRFKGETFALESGVQPLLQLFMQACRERTGPLAGVLAESLMHLIVRNTLPERPALPEAVAVQGRINAAVEHIHLHYAFDLELKTLAGVAGLSVSHFARCFRDALGMSAGEYLLRVRLQHVKKLLESGEKKVTEAALAAGFNSASYMARRFKAAFGETPTEYARRFK